MKLSTKQRKAIPQSEFALPEKRAFPLNNSAHARNALARAHFASPAEQATIRAKVHSRFKNIKIGGKS